MARRLGIGIAVGGLLLVPFACTWGEEFHGCETEPCGTTTGGSSGTGGSGGGADAGGSGGDDGSDSTTDGSSTLTTGDGGTTGAGGSTTGGGEAGESGAAGASGSGGDPPTCDGELSPRDDACVANEEFGVFVSPRGDDATGDGTREAPFATLQKGADVASEQGKRLYACATGGAYVAPLSLSEQHDELELYGSFECSDWSYDAALRASVAPAEGVALTVSEIPTSLAIDGFSFESVDATERGTSSIAAEIRTSFGVLLRNVALRAGAGATGTSGATGKFTHPSQGEFNGVDGTEEWGGVMSALDCPAGDETFGGGGGFPDPEVVNEGGPGLPNHDGPGGEGGTGIDEDCVGQDGADGPAGADGAGATKRGALVNGSWMPTAGSDGFPGLPGQGGGGGAGGLAGGGGSGSAGSCGLAGGGAGGGGGASIALLLLDADVDLVDAEVVAGNGGPGGPGGLSERRTITPGDPGEGFSDGCDGGRGGKGGSGGGGGGGAGGISVGILFQGAPPVRTNTNVTAGAKGRGGGGGGTDNDGVDGFAERELDIAEV